MSARCKTNIFFQISFKYPYLLKKKKLKKIRFFIIILTLTLFHTKNSCKPHECWLCQEFYFFAKIVLNQHALFAHPIYFVDCVYIAFPPRQKERCLTLLGLSDYTFHRFVSYNLIIRSESSVFVQGVCNLCACV